MGTKEINVEKLMSELTRFDNLVKNFEFQRVDKDKSSIKCILCEYLIDNNCTKAKCKYIKRGENSVSKQN